MRGDALHRQPRLGHAGGHEQHALVLGHCLGGGGLVGQHHVVRVAERGDGFARAVGADFLVGVEQHRQARIVRPAGVAQDGQRMQDHRDAALVVGNAGPVELVAVQPVRFGGEDALAVDGVHVRDEQEVALAGAGEAALDHLARPDARRDALGHGAQCAQPGFDVVGHALQAGGVLRTGFDRHHLAQRLNHRRLRAACGGQQLLVGGHRLGAGTQGQCGELHRSGRARCLHPRSPWIAWAVAACRQCRHVQLAMRHSARPASTPASAVAACPVAR